MTLKIVTWNLNSLKARLEHLIVFLEQYQPDIVCLQELKCETDKFPKDELSALPYNLYIHGQKAYNGVAILSKIPAEEIKLDFPNNPLSQQARFIEISLKTPIGYSRVISLYAPNGGEVGSEKFAAKLEFYDEFTNYIKQIISLDEKLIIGSDFNIAPFDIDVHSPRELNQSTCCTLIERRKLRYLLNLGLVDNYRVIHPDKKEFSWWDYRAGAFEQNKGLRIDSILTNPSATRYLSDAYIDYNCRGKNKPSDHAPVMALYST